MTVCAAATGAGAACWQCCATIGLPAHRRFEPFFRVPPPPHCSLLHTRRAMTVTGTASASGRGRASPEETRGVMALYGAARRCVAAVVYILCACFVAPSCSHFMPSGPNARAGMVDGSPRSRLSYITYQGAVSRLGRADCQGPIICVAAGSYQCGRCRQPSSALLSWPSVRDQARPLPHWCVAW